MSLPDLTDSGAGRGVVLQKAKSDIYTVMLGIALTAIMIACILLWLEWKRYDYDLKASGYRATASVSSPLRTALSGKLPATAMPREAVRRDS